MTSIEELKKDILNNTLNNGIFVFKGNEFLIQQYITAIVKDEDVCFSDNFEKSVLNNDNVNSWIIIRCKVFETTLPLENITNVIVICEENKTQLFTYEFPLNLENWMIEEYCKNECKNLSLETVKYLCSVCDYNICRIDMICNKLSMFDNQDEMFDLLMKDSEVDDLPRGKIFDLTNALLLKKEDDIHELMKYINTIDVEPMGLITILKKSFNNLISLALDVHATPSKYNMSEKQFNFLKRNVVSLWSNEKLIENYDFLTSYDYRLKNGELPLTKEESIDYIILKILN